MPVTHKGLNMFRQLTLRTRFRIKQFGYLLFLLAPLAPLTAWLIARQTQQWNLMALYVPFVLFVLIPIADWIIGKDPVNPEANEEVALKASRYYPALLVLCLPLQLAMLGLGGQVLVTAPFSLAGQVLWTLSIGLVGGILAINTGHELIHKPSRFLQAVGGALLACVSYTSFKVEHIYGHHVTVATPQDNSTALRGENVYHFIVRAFRHNVGHALRLERANHQRRQRPHNLFTSELARWYLLTAALAAACTFAWGWAGLLYFIGQSAAAIALLEMVNYLEHYGLMRHPDGRGGYERVDPTHSWNSNFLLTNLLLFQLQRHSDHHAFAARPYQTLRHHEHSPQLPAGYAAMVVLALIPPLWRRIMDPRADAYNLARAQKLPGAARAATGNVAT
jgi:alkane 1-monooxygenase